MTDYNDMLMGSGGGRSASLKDDGDAVDGVIQRIETRQRTDFDTGKPMTWEDGNPRMQLVVTLATAEREDNDDDGMRNLYVPIPSDIQSAVADAVRKAGQRGLGEGGRLWVKHVSTDEPTRKGRNGTKRHTAKYEAPTVPVGNAEDPGFDPDAPFHHEPFAEAFENSVARWR